MPVTRRALSLGFAASTLACAIWLYNCPLGIYGPIMVYPFVGAPTVVGLAALRAALVRKLGVGADPTALALEVLALGAMLAPGAGYLIVVTCLHDMGGDHCGLVDMSGVGTVLARSWPLCGAGEVVALVALVRRAAGLARLGSYRALATVLTLIAAPPLALLACITTCFERNHGGAGIAFLLPAALAAGATVASSTAGRPSATVPALRRVAVALLILGVPLSLVLRSRAPLPQSCVSFWTTSTWSLLAEVGWVAAPCLAVMLLGARDPIPPAADGLP